MTATPNAMPKKNFNQIQAKILAALIETRNTSWTHKRIDPESPNPYRPIVIETEIRGKELRYPLARNVSEFNIERTARKWVK